MATCWLAKQNLVTKNIKYIYDSSSGGRRYQTMIAHISQGPSNASTKGWFETYPKIVNGVVLPEKQQYAGAHFGIEKDGHIEQFVDTQYICWGAGSANLHAIHVENVGYPTDRLTDAQIVMLGNILAWANQTHGIALELNYPLAFSSDSPNVAPISSDWYKPLNTGLGFHAQYGGHPGCPGQGVVSQLPQVLKVAKDIASGAQPYRLM
jgi:N-acetylmuramoyl-L-alanine amidase